MRTSHWLLLLLLYFFAQGIKAQTDPVADSLKKLILNAPDDTSRLYHMDDLIWWNLYSDIDQAYSQAHSALQMSSKTGSLLSIGRANHTMGTIYLQIGRYDSALFYFRRGINYFEKGGYPDKAASGLNGIGNVYYSKGVHQNALKYYLAALEKCNPENRDKTALLNANIGAVYSNLKNYQASIEYTTESMKISEETGDSLGIATCLNNLGNDYSSLGDFNSARQSFIASLEINKRLNQKFRLAEIYNNLGVLESRQDRADSAAFYYRKSLEIYQEMNNPEGIAQEMANLGNILKTLGEKEKARTLLLGAERIALQNYSRERLIGILGPLHEMYAEEKNYPKAYDYLLRFHYLKDSVYGTESARQMAEIQTKYDLEKKEQEILLLNKETELQTAQLHRQSLQRNGLLTGLGILALFGIIITRSYRQKQKANQLLTERKKIIEKAHGSLLMANTEITRQKSVIEARNRDITDSINYARRIQDTILAPPSSIREIFPDSFLLYLPKDIVSGDFYYFTSTETHHFLAVADCTGHGVPGALVSIVCSNALDKAIREQGHTEPGKILDSVRNLVIENFRRSGHDVKDGMDISLCSIRKDKSEVLWAGANNPIWMVHPNENGEPVVNEIKGDKQPVGLMADMKPFTTHTINIIPGTRYYLFSDGLADQFGGEKGKKLKSVNLKSTLLSLQTTPLPQLETSLTKWFRAWQGDLEQVDDVCLIGFSLS